ncbi:MAG: hypothetical protein PWQ91_1507 [Eubacteriales bacterium]|nr:hypothetical protein [Eubacteriales bacterium]
MKPRYYFRLLLFLTFCLVLIAGTAGCKGEGAYARGSANLKAGQEFDIQTAAPKIAQALAKKAGEENPRNIRYEEKKDPLTGSKVYVIKMDGTFQDKWAGTGYYVKRMEITLDENGRVFLLAGYYEGKLLWQKAFTPVAWDFLAR